MGQSLRTQEGGVAKVLSVT